MKKFIFILLVLLFSVWVGVKVAADPGYAFFAWRHWTVQMPLWFLVVSGMLFLLLFYLLISTIHRIDNLFIRWKHWLQMRKIKKSV
ncbi:hypothetical protein AYO45_03820 [Gammaproteobacteria bacterium SCGC AG-212-F23]|nr:hypothetical protein AYO45_03820 [Gammaproteobacteria bacterium SCGC AG-212-F23]